MEQIFGFFIMPKDQKFRKKKLKSLKFAAIILILTSVFSCQNFRKAKFEITNKTEGTIDSISISSFNHNFKTEYIKLEIGQSQTYWLDMNNLPEVDGSYRLTYKDSVINNKNFGYFSNGYPMKTVTNITFEKDTVIIHPKYE